MLGGHARAQLWEPRLNLSHTPPDGLSHCLRGVPQVGEPRYAVRAGQNDHIVTSGEQHIGKAQQRIDMPCVPVACYSHTHRLTTAMLDEKSIRDCQRSGSFVCVAFLTSSADELGTQRPLTDCRVDLHLGARDVLVHPRIGALLRLHTMGGSMRVPNDAPT